MSKERKYQIDVQAQSTFLPEQSDPDDETYVFSYRIVIRNSGDVAAQLISRHWIITDANGKVQEVRGLGVVGEQPVIEPGQSFEYSSGCTLETAFGTMSGSYQMEASDGTHFDAPIPEFILSGPRVLH
ncbi:MAG: Co2+/Mg2+ efflux protein ApaG [Rhodocyclaceae bacterium]